MICHLHHFRAVPFKWQQIVYHGPGNPNILRSHEALFLLADDWLRKPLNTLCNLLAEYNLREQF